ncbi:MAG TPA: BrnA antitoxin family protein [Rhodothermales bacterium]|nr:BrnA antitoxin family protein [Rhodothermales bacterium]
MKRKGTIVRRTLEEIEAMQRAGQTKTDWERLDNMTEEEIERNALEDNRRNGIPDDWYEDSVLVTWPPKEPISICVDEDVLEYFRGQGKGYQRRMNDVLRAFMEVERNAKR